MGLLSWIGGGDPFADTLRGLFGANIVRMPEEGIQPLAVVAARGDQAAWRGALSELLVGTPPIPLQPSDNVAALISGKQSRRVSLDVGLDILKSVLAGFQLPSAGIDAAFEGASEVSFSFNDVTRRRIDINELGSILRDVKIDNTHPAASIFFGPTAWDLLIIDSVITSNSFSFSVETARSSTFRIDLGPIQELIGEVNAGVSTSVAAERVVSFKGPKRLTFAFTCVRLYLRDRGDIAVIYQDETQRQLADAEGAGGAQQLVMQPPPHVLLSRTPAMIDWDPWPERSS